jgi:ADP-ribose pyrophosphatase YjhB (NUDIX family)
MDTNLANINLQPPVYGGKLRVRVCGILLQDKKILVVRHQNILGDYNLWVPPGGGVNFGEKICDSLVREFYEETGLKIKAGRFLFLQEFLQEPLHALELFFEVEAVGGTLKTGSDPELPADDQIISEVVFKTLPELRREKEVELHQIFKDLIDLDD